MAYSICSDFDSCVTHESKDYVEYFYEHKSKKPQTL